MAPAWTTAAHTTLTLAWKPSLEQWKVSEPLVAGLPLLAIHLLLICGLHFPLIGMFLETTGNRIQLILCCF